MDRFLAYCLLILLSSGQAATASPSPGRVAEAGDSRPLVWVFPLTGAVTPPMAATLHRWFVQAHTHTPSLIILRIDTPGGLSSSMRAIIKDILASTIPVVGFVAPSGARAASAGTYILYACPIAAMAEGTNVGSATPVPIGSPLASSPDSAQKSKTHNPSPSDAEDRKILNDSVAFIKSLADINGHNARWAEDAVIQAANLPAREALKMHVIDLIAPDPSTLVSELDGRTVPLKGASIALHLKNPAIRTFQPDWKDTLLDVIAKPEMAYLLLLLGLAGLAFEFSHPGYVLPGVTGLLAILLALYAFTVLPVNLTGVILLIIGLALMVAEVVIGAFGSLAVAGMLAFFLGSLLFFHAPHPEGVPIVHPPLVLIVLITLFVALFFLGVLRMAIRARFRPVLTGVQAIGGERGIALENFRIRGRIKVHSEIWWATSPVPVKEGENVVVLGISGLTLTVKPAPEEIP